nr:hypothetical protein [Methylomagnum ishizawai]
MIPLFNSQRPSNLRPGYAIRHQSLRCLETFQCPLDAGTEGRNG